MAYGEQKVKLPPGATLIQEDEIKLPQGATLISDDDVKKKRFYEQFKQWWRTYTFPYSIKFQSPIVIRKFPEKE